MLRLGLGEVRNVLEQHCSRVQPVDNGEEAAPEISPFVAGASASSPHQITDLRHAGGGKWLAWRTTSKKVHALYAPIVQVTKELSGLERSPVQVRP